MDKNNKKPKKDYCKDTPKFSEEIRSRLCRELFLLTEDISDEGRQRDIIIFSLIILLSGCFPGVYGVYFGNKVCPNLYGIICGPPASGKGAMLLAKLIGDIIHASMVEENNKRMAKYREDLAEWKKSKAGPKPIKPKLLMFYIPGNISAAGFISLLQMMGRGVIFETEVDTLTLIFEQKFGDFTDSMRKAWHHEAITSFRKIELEYNSIQFPILTMLLSGTPNQLPKLVRTAGNGLLSRVCFLIFNGQTNFSDPFAVSHSNTAFLFKQFGDRIAQKYFLALTQPEREFQLTEDQKKRFNEKFPPIVDDYYDGVGSEGVSIPMRMGLIFFRIAMILTAVRNIDNDQMLICEDDDFEAANLIVDVLLSHSLAVYSSLPSTEDEDNEGLMTPEVLLSKLPPKFESEKAIKAMAEFGYCRKTAFRALSELCKKGLIQRTKRGHYAKTSV